MDSSLLLENPFFSGGLVLMILGGLLVWLRSVPLKIYNFIERFFIIKMEILDEDEAYHWMQVWLSERLKKTLSISVVTHRQKDDSDDNDFKIKENKPKVYFVPACGTYFFWYKRRFVTLNRDRKDNATSSSPLMQNAVTTTSPNNIFRTKESFTLRIFSRNVELARQLIEDCREKAIPDDGKIDIRIANYSYWALGTRTQTRTLDSVILAGNQMEFLLNDIQKFQESQKWYQSVGVPWRRGYLLEGPPGSGKTSVIKALAGELKMNVYMLMLSDSEMSDSRFNDLLAKVGDNSILLLEDVDCAFTNRRKSNGKSLTFSGLLNGIDGVATPEGRMVFMTTNHKERLDPALIRPGRVDIHLHIGNATKDQASRLFNRFFPEYNRDFGALIPDGFYSMATLQNYLMQYRDAPLEALEHVSDVLPIMMANSQPLELLESPQELDLLSNEDELAD